MSDYRYVDLTVDDMPLRGMAGLEQVGVDTEFMRERTYFSELCLIQVAYPDGSIFCADPLGRHGQQNRPADEFWEALMQPEWVLHSGRQDIEVIVHTSGRMPRRVFDTQIAAALLGHQPQIGYAGLVRELFGVELDKTHTRADWSRRPLGDELLRYAAEDVQYLLPAREELVPRLERCGRLQWVLQDSMDLLEPALYATDPSLAIDRLKGARNLRGNARAAAVRLATWREREALRSNRPRQWILRDPVLLEIATRAPKSLPELGDIEGLAEKTIRRAGTELLQAVDSAGRDDNRYTPPPRPDERQKAALREMQRTVDAAAGSLDIAAELLAPRKELSAAMLGNRNSRVFRGWRQELIGKQLLSILENI